MTIATNPSRPATYRPSFTWDAHACLPLDEKTPENLLDEYVKGNVDYVCVNVGMDMNTIPHILRVIAAFRAKIAAHPDKYMQIDSFDDLAIAKQKGLLGVGFDLEGSVMLTQLGVRNTPAVVDPSVPWIEADGLVVVPNARPNQTREPE